MSKKARYLKNKPGDDEMLVRHLFDGFAIYDPGHVSATYRADRPDLWPRLGKFTEAYRDELAEQWPRLRESVFALARVWSKQRKGCYRLPFFWWLLEAPERRDHRIKESEQLERLGIDPVTLIFGQEQ